MTYIIKEVIRLKCTSCTQGNIILKDEVTYVYHYHIKDDGSIKWDDEEAYAPYLFFNRDQKDFNQKVQCDNCNKEYDFKIAKDHDQQMIILKKAIHSNNMIDSRPFV